MSPMLKAAMKTTENAGMDLIKEARKINKKSPDSELAKMIGATADDIGAITLMVDNQNPQGARARLISKGVSGGLKYMGFAPAEDIVRKQAVIAADFMRHQWMHVYDSTKNADKLVDAIYELHATPKNKALKAKVDSLIKADKKNGKLLAEAARYAARQDINLNAMADERFAKIMGKNTPVPFNPDSQPNTRRFLQSWPKQTQGGYQIDQLPLFMQKQGWKTFLKFQSWGMQMHRHNHMNILPEMKAGNLQPAMKWILAGQAGGETVGELGRLFGRDRTDADRKEIAKTFETSTGKGVAMVLNRMVNNLAIGGQWDFFGGMIGEPVMRTSKTGAPDPMSMPVLGLADGVVDYFHKGIKTGWGSDESFAALGRIASPVGKTAQLVREAIGDKPQQYETERRKLARFVKERFLRESEYAKRMHMDPEGAAKLKGQITPTLMSSKKREVVKAIQRGDAEEAKKLADEFVKWEMDKPDVSGMGKKYPVKGDEEFIRDGLAYTVRRAQPLKVGRATSAEATEALEEFMKREDYDSKVVLELQEDYLKTAKEAGFIKEPIKPTEAEVKAAIARKGKYGTTKARAEAVRFYNENKALFDRTVKDDNRNDINAGVRQARLVLGDVGYSNRISKEENIQRQEFWNQKVMNQIKSIATSKDRDKTLLSFYLPKGFDSIPTSFYKAEFIDEHLTALDVPRADRGLIVNRMLNSKLISPRDDLAYTELFLK